MADRKRLSKILSLILRHRAQDLELTLDSQGFVDYDAVREVFNCRAERAILLKVRASDAHNFGISFYNPEPEHFLAKAIPASFIDFPYA